MKKICFIILICAFHYLFSQDTLKSDFINEIRVTANYLERKGDRFIMTISNEPAFTGKSAQEILIKVPGVWVDNNGISINGVSGTKIYINGRELKLTQEQLNLYLSSLNSENIRKIEVLPVAGAEYEAQNKGGIINITLKRKV